MGAALDLPKAELLERLRNQVAAAEGRARSQPFRIPDVLASVLGEPGLKPGCVYSLNTSGALLLAMLAPPSQDGNWCGVVSLPGFGVEAAQQAGVRLERLVLVPEPGEHWLAVTAALAEVLPVLVVRPGGRVRAGEATRLASRLRDRGGVLLVAGAWPRVEASFTVTAPRWQGLGSGFGHLARRELAVSVTSRRFPASRQVRVVLPTEDGGLAPSAAQTRIADGVGIRAVG